MCIVEIPQREGFTPTLLCLTLPRMGYKNKSDSISLIVRCEIRCRDIIKASPDMPAKMLACQRSLTKYSHADIIDEFYLARTVLTMLKLRDDREGREMARYLEWLLLKTETRDRRQAPFRF
jgi:hypothetical protein